MVKRVSTRCGLALPRLASRRLLTESCHARGIHVRFHDRLNKYVDVRVRLSGYADAAETPSDASSTLASHTDGEHPRRQQRHERTQRAEQVTVQPFIP